MAGDAASSDPFSSHSATPPAARLRDVFVLPPVTGQPIIFFEGALMDSTETDLKARLVFFRDKIPTWALKASALKSRVGEIRNASEINEPELLAIETSLGELHEETAAFNELVGAVSRISPVASAELAEAGDAFRLILLELTELSVALYSVRSGLNEISGGIDTLVDGAIESLPSPDSATAP